MDSGADLLLRVVDRVAIASGLSAQQRSKLCANLRSGAVKLEPWIEDSTDVVSNLVNILQTNPRPKTRRELDVEAFNFAARVAKRGKLPKSLGKNQMDVERFWHIIQSVHNLSPNNMLAKKNLLVQTLSSLSAADAM